MDKTNELVTADNLTDKQIIARICAVHHDPIRFSRPSHELLAECAAALCGDHASRSMIAAAINARNAAVRRHWPDCSMNHGGSACDMGPECGTHAAVRK